MGSFSGGGRQNCANTKRNKDENKVQEQAFKKKKFLKQTILTKYKTLHK